MRTNPLSTKGFLLCIYYSINELIIFGYTLSIKEILRQKK